MKDRVEPPILLSRILTFVLAVSVIVAFALGITLKNMFPLNKPQVFFLRTEVRNNLDIKLVEMLPTSDVTERYIYAFVREYVRARNEIFDDAKVMNKKWNGENGLVKTWSTEDVYAAFSKTAMVKDLRNGRLAKSELICSVEYPQKDYVKYLTSENVYQVKFTYFCENNTGTIPPKDYTITLRLITGENNVLRWTDRVDNPLGLRISEYKVTSGGIDPLNNSLLTN